MTWWVPWQTVSLAIIGLLAMIPLRDVAARYGYGIAVLLYLIAIGAWGASLRP